MSYTATFSGLGAADNRPIPPNYTRPGCTQTTTVREQRGLRTFLHYLDPADPEVTLCGVAKAATVAHTWSLAVTNCWDCERVARHRCVGP